MDNLEHLKIEADTFVKGGKTVIVENRSQKKIYKIIGYDGLGEFQAELQNVENEADIIRIGLPGVLRAIKKNEILKYG